MFQIAVQFGLDYWIVTNSRFFIKLVRIRIFFVMAIAAITDVLYYHGFIIICLELFVATFILFSFLGRWLVVFSFSLLEGSCASNEIFCKYCAIT